MKVQDRTRETWEKIKSEGIKPCYRCFKERGKKVEMVPQDISSAEARIVIHRCPTCATED